jgi:hypothetical protein
MTFYHRAGELGGDELALPSRAYVAPSQLQWFLTAAKRAPAVVPQVEVAAALIYCQ